MSAAARARVDAHASGPMADRAETVERLRAGDAAAFDALYGELTPPLRIFAYRLVRSREAAVDIVHDVFLALWRTREQLAIERGLRAYLYRATRNRALDWLAREKVRRRWGEVDASMPDATADDVAAAAEQADVLRAVVAAIEAMPERRRIVCSLRWREGRSLAEIALSLGISQKTVETQLSRGLKELRARFR